MFLTLISTDWKNPDRSQNYRKRSPNVHRKALERQFSGDLMTRARNNVDGATSRSNRIRTNFAGLIALTLLILSATFTATAQQTNATIVGNVTDSTGAVMAGAKVTATEAATNAVRSTVTDSAGAFTLPSLPVGTYSLSVEIAGFQSQRADGIVLDASQTARQDFKMAVGQVNQTVAVEAGAAAAQLQTESGAVGQVIDGRKIVFQ